MVRSEDANIGDLQDQEIVLGTFDLVNVSMIMVCVILGEGKCHVTQPFPAVP